MKKYLFVLSLISSVCMADTNLTNDIWSIRFERSQMDDSISVFMSTQSLEPFNKYGKNVRAYMLIRCRNNSTDLMIGYPGIFLNNNSIKIEYRLDKDKSVKATWDTSTDFEATFAKKPVSVIKSMFDKDRMLIKVTPYGKSPITLPFNISGLKESIEPLRKACKW